MKKWLRMALMLVAVIALLTTAAFAAGINLDGYDDDEGRGWEWDASRQTLYLDDADLSKGIYINGDATIELDGDNYITLDEDSDERYAIYCSGDLTITGRGELTIYNEAGFGIYAERNLLIEDTDITVEYSASDAIYAYNADVTIYDSFVKVEESDLCAIVGQFGSVEVDSSEIEIGVTSYRGIYAYGDLTIEDSIVEIDYAVFPLDIYEDLYIEDSTVTILEAEYDAIYVESGARINDSTLLVGRAGSDGMTADTLQITDSEVTVQEASAIGIDVHHIEVEDSRVYASGEYVALLVRGYDEEYSTVAFNGLRLRGSTREFQENLDRLYRLDDEVVEFEDYDYTLMMDGSVVRTLTIGSYRGDFETLPPTMETRVVSVLSDLIYGERMPYNDVPSNAWYHDAVQEAYQAGHMVGVGGATFAPDQPLTRAMLWTVLARLNNASTYSEGLWYEGAQQWAIINGVSDGKNPDEAVSVEELITMVWRNCGNPYRVAYLDSYADHAKVSSWAVDAMKWAKDQGLLRGELLNPQADATRAYTAHVLVGA